jgi:Arm DNA-binding domain
MVHLEARRSAGIANHSRDAAVSGPLRPDSRAEPFIPSHGVTRRTKIWGNPSFHLGLLSTRVTYRLLVQHGSTSKSVATTLPRDLRLPCWQQLADFSGRRILPRKTLTDRAVAARNPLNRQPPYDVMDTIVPGFGMRVLASGRRTYILTSRFPGSRNPTRRALGACGVLTLEAARAKARSWLEMLAAGKDPSVEIERAKRVEQRQRETRFGPVLERYIEEAVVGPNPAEPLQRSWRVTARDMRRELAPWNKRPISDIDRQDVVTLLQGIKRRSPAQGYNVWGYVRSIFGWAINDGGYGLTASPCDHINIAKLLGAKKVRDRILDDVEFAAFWNSVAKLAYPHRQAYEFLALTGLRLTEVTEAR